MWPWSAVLVSLIAHLAGAPTPDAASAESATVAGVVFDSVAREPLAGARVQLVSADTVTNSRSTISDAQGRFAFAGVPAGGYTIGFFHAMLDSLGLEPPLRRIVVAGARRVRADLAVPSPARLRTAICGAQSAENSGGVILGVVRDPVDGSPMSDVTVTAEWLELIFSIRGISQQARRRESMTLENGYYALCDIPSPGIVLLGASRGADSTGRIEIETTSDGFLRRELYLGAARVVAEGSPLAMLAPRRILHGDGRLSGVVVGVAQGNPLRDALVGILDGPETRTNEAGEWTLTNVPAGTRTLLVRAVGFYPHQRSVDVVPNAPSLRIELATFRAVLAEVKVSARRLGDRFRGFEDRRRSAAGRYITDEDIARWRPSQTSDIFKYLPGVRIVRRELETIVVLRGAIADTAFADTTASAGTICQPPIYLDGHSLSTVPLEAVDDMVMPREIVAIEVYVGGTVPPQFDERRTGCGAILIWTRR